jgi:hypothetical protein
MEWRKMGSTGEKGRGAHLPKMVARAMAPESPIQFLPRERIVREELVCKQAARADAPESVMRLSHKSKETS